MKMKVRSKLALSIAALLVIGSIFAILDASKDDLGGVLRPASDAAVVNPESANMEWQEATGVGVPDRTPVLVDTTINFIDAESDAEIPGVDFSGVCTILIQKGTTPMQLKLPIRRGQSVYSPLNKSEGHFERGFVLSAHFDGRTSITHFDPVSFSIEDREVSVLVGGEGERLVDVVDALTGRRIPFVSTLEHNRSVWEPIHAIEPPLLKDAALSSVPFSVRGHEEGKTIWIGSPGYSWNPVDLHPSDVDVQVVKLQRSASLTFKCRGAYSATIYLDRLLPVVGSAHVGAYTVEGGGELQLEGLPAGKYKAHAKSSTGELCLSERGVTLLAGEAKTVGLSTDSAVAERQVRLVGRSAERMLGMAFSICSGQVGIVQRLENGIGFVLANGAAYDSSGISFMLSGSNTVFTATQSPGSNDFVCQLPKTVLVGIHSILEGGRALEFLQITAMASEGGVLADIRGCLGEAMVAQDAAADGWFIEAPLGGELFVLGRLDGVFISERIAVDSEELEVLFPSIIHSTVLLTAEDDSPPLSTGWLSGIRVVSNSEILDPFDVVITPLGRSARISFIGALDSVFIPELHGHVGRWISRDANVTPESRFLLQMPSGRLETIRD